MDLRGASDRSWRLESVGGGGLGSADLTALWAVLLLGAPTILVGMRLTTPEAAGGNGFTLAQLALVAPLGVVIGAVLLGATAWVGAYNGVPAGLLARPALGTWASRLMGVARIVLLVYAAVLQIQVAALLITGGLELAGWPTLPQSTAIWLVTALVGAFLVAGPELVARSWVRWFAFWVGLVLALGATMLAFDRNELGSLLQEPGVAAVFPGLDAVVALAVLWFPVVGDFARHSDDEGAAASAVGVGFAVPVLILVMVGGVFALVGTAPDVGGLTALMGALFPGLLGGALVLLWALSANLSQPFAFIYGGATSVQILVGRLPGRLAAVALAIAAGFMAAHLEPADLVPVVELLLTVIAPLLAIHLVDFFFVRKRSYDLDALYLRESRYRANWLGIVALVVGLVVAQWIRPMGPVAVVEIVRVSIPGGVPFGELIGLPALVVGMATAAAIYAPLGRWKIDEPVHVSKMRI